MKSTPPARSARRRPPKSAATRAGGTLHLAEGAHEGGELLQALAWGELQVLAKQRAIDVLLVGLDDRVRFQFGGPGSRRRLAHDQESSTSGASERKAEAAVSAQGAGRARAGRRPGEETAPGRRGRTRRGRRGSRSGTVERAATRLRP